MSRRQEDLRTKSSLAMSRDRRDDFGHDMYLTTRRGGAQEDRSFRSRRNLSPQHTQEGTQRTIVRQRRSNSLERRRDYERNHDRVHDDLMLSRSPLIGHREQRPFIDERDYNLSPTSTQIRRKYEISEKDFDYMKPSSTHPRSYDDHREIGKKDYSERGSGAGSMVQSSVPIEAAVDREVGLLPKYGYVTRYGEASGSYSTVDVHRLKEENAWYQDAPPREKLIKDKFYEDGEKSAYYSRESPYLEYPPSQLKDFGSEDPLKGFPSTSSGINVRGEYLSKLKDVRTLPSDEYRGSGGKVIETVDNDYDRRNILNDGRDYEAGFMDGKCYECDAHTSARAENTNYHYSEFERGGNDDPSKNYDYPEIGRRGNDDLGKNYDYPEFGRRGNDDLGKNYHNPEFGRRGNDDLGKNYHNPEFGHRGNDDPGYIPRRDSYEKMTYVRGEHDYRDLLRPVITDMTIESIAKAEGSHSSGRVREVDIIQNRMTTTDYVEMRRSSDAFKQAGDYLDNEYAHVELTKKVSNHNHNSKFGGLHEHEFEDPHLDYGYGRYTPAGSHRARVENSPELKNDVELQRRVGLSERIKAKDPVVYDRPLKRKYVVDEDISRVDSRSVIPSKRNLPTGDNDYNDHRVEWVHKKSSVVHPRRPSRYERNHNYVDAEKKFDETYRDKDRRNDDWTSYQDLSKRIQQHSGKPLKVGGRHLKGYTRPESSKSYGSVPHSHHRNNQYNQRNVGQRSEDGNHMAVREKDAELSQDYEGPWKSEPSEDSEGYKQKVLAAFLDFSKRFNENPTARKLYKEQGKAGSLFCVVCRRSSSKEFQDTKALASHAFMSHKVGLRPQHLGLHKAICVLMGWNPIPDPDSGTWAPEALPQPEALAQREDLILWPPVVVLNNISLSNNDHNEWKLINIDTLGEFLRARGFALGKMKICLGNPGDHSIILVKFLGTFSGLQEAERLHKYFIERKHGRVDFEQAISSIGKGGNVIRGDNEAEKLEDVLLYGYMGIAEDLDCVDFDTKKRCSIKSKREIHDLADAPVKPE